MGHLLAAGHCGATGTGFETLQHGSVLDEGELDREAVSGKVIIVLGVRDSALESLGDKLRGFARNEREIFEGFDGFSSLNDAGDIAHLLRRHARVACEGLYFHGDDGDG